jgi:hypothetical protein
MVPAQASAAHPARRRTAWLALLALLLNITLPTLAIRALPPADLFAGVICHAAGQPAQQDEQPGQQAPTKGTCPLCILFAGQAVAVLPAEGITLPRPMARAMAMPRAPPSASALPAQTSPPAARGPPILA